jgi:hypothetical protein
VKNKPLEYLLKINSATVDALAKYLKLAYTPEILPRGNVCMAENLEVRPEFRHTFTGVNLKNFLYAILHSSSFEASRTTHLHCDFTQCCFPANTDDFWKLADYGETLIRLHATGISGSFTLESIFPENGNNIIEPSSILFEAESQKIWINKRQYFQNIPAHVWEYRTGGTQLLRQWIEIRSGQKLKSYDIGEFIRLTEFIQETMRISKKIDDILKFSPSPGKS